MMGKKFNFTDAYIERMQAIYERHAVLVADINDLLRTGEATDHEALQLKRELRGLLTDEERDE